MFSYYSKVTIILFQFHQAEYKNDNHQLSRLVGGLKNSLKKRYANTRVGYAWAREHGKKGNDFHYHIAFMVNGSLCKSSHHLWLTAHSLCKSVSSNNYIWLPKRNTYRLHRYTEPAHINSARMRMSYAAKRRSKEQIPTGIDKFGFSQLTFNKVR